MAVDTSTSVGVGSDDEGVRSVSRTIADAPEAVAEVVVSVFSALSSVDVLGCCCWATAVAEVNTNAHIAMNVVTNSKQVVTILATTCIVVWLYGCFICTVLVCEVCTIDTDAAVSCLSGGLLGDGMAKTQKGLPPLDVPRCVTMW